MYIVELMTLERDVPETWHVVGPWHTAPHVKAAWGCATKEEAEQLAEKMNAGYIPLLEEES